MRKEDLVLFPSVSSGKKHRCVHSGTLGQVAARRPTEHRSVGNTGAGRRGVGVRGAGLLSNHFLFELVGQMFSLLELLPLFGRRLLVQSEQSVEEG